MNGIIILGCNQVLFLYIGTLKEIDIESMCESLGELTHTHDSIL